MRRKNGNLILSVLAMVIMFIAPAAFGTIVPGDYMHHWDFETGSGLAIDTAGSADGTLAGNAAYTTNALYGNYSVELDGGSGSKVSTASGAVSLGDSYAISMLINPHTAGEANGGRLFSTQPTGTAGGLALILYPNSDVNSPEEVSLVGFFGESSSNNEYLVLGGTMRYNEISHVVLTNAGSGQYKLYINGEQVDSFTSYQSMASDYFVIGNQPVDIRAFDGEIDEVALFNRDLTGTEVTELYNSLVVPEPATLSLIGLGALGLIRRKK